MQSQGLSGIIPGSGVAAESWGLLSVYGDGLQQGSKGPAAVEFAAAALADCSCNGWLGLCHP